MDPNANLREQEQLLRLIDRLELLDLRQALYDWIRDGGFEPDWSVAPTACKYYGQYVIGKTVYSI